jgi:multidrug resistance efflux pump
MTMAMERRREVEMTASADGEVGEILVRIDERFDRAEERNAERFVRLEQRTDERFERIDERLTRAEEKTDERFDHLLRHLARNEERDADRWAETVRRFEYVDGQLERTNDRLDSLVRVMIAGNVSLTVGILAGFVSIVALILTQL